MLSLSAPGARPESAKSRFPFDPSRAAGAAPKRIFSFCRGLGRGSTTPRPCGIPNEEPKGRRRLLPASRPLAQSRPAHRRPGVGVCQANNAPNFEPTFPSSPPLLFPPKKRKKNDKPKNGQGCEGETERNRKKLRKRERKRKGEGGAKSLAIHSRPGRIKAPEGAKTERLRLARAAKPAPSSRQSAGRPKAGRRTNPKRCWRRGERGAERERPQKQR